MMNWFNELWYTLFITIGSYTLFRNFRCLTSRFISVVHVGWVEHSETQHGAPIRWVSATASTQPTQVNPMLPPNWLTTFQASLALALSDFPDPTLSRQNGHQQRL